MTAPLWRLPEQALVFDHALRRYKVMGVRGQGQARAVFIPLRQHGGAWELAMAPGESLPLTVVEDGKRSAVPRVGGAQGCVYLCAIRYDLPSNHPDESFFVDDSVGMPPPATIDGTELAKVFAGLAAHSPDRIAQDVVDGPADVVIGIPAGGAIAPIQFTARGRAGPVTSVAVPATAPPRDAAGGQRPSELAFAFGSCQYPAGMVDREIAQASYRAFATHLKAAATPPERLLLLGDQVYVDATYGLLDPARLDDRYRMPYEDLLDRNDGPLRHVPMPFLAASTHMTPDDHEFLDNWEPFGRRVNSPRFKKGLKAFWQHQRASSRRNTRGVQLKDSGPGWRLFMTDTRTQRGYRSVETLHRAMIMSTRQAADLEQWLVNGDEDDLRIVTSAAMLLPRSREYIDDPLYLDNWQGYPVSLYRLLAWLCEHEVPNVVFLSGDAHLACSAQVSVTNVDSGRSVEFMSHHAPALYAPFPFANETRHNLVLEDAFHFSADIAGTTGTYECTVHTQLVDEGHDGCGLMTARRNGSTWSTKVDVLRERA